MEDHVVGAAALLADPAAHRWDELLADAEAGIGVRTVYQPIIDLQRRVVAGYEALTRFEAPVSATPDLWFAAAAHRGRLGRLEAVSLRSALARRADLPPNCFLTVNVEPESLLDHDVMAEFARFGHLGGIVVEVTEHRSMQDPDLQLDALEQLRARGALIAVDDAGAGHSGLQQILDMRPSILKLDRALVEGIDRDEAKAALVEMLGVFANRVDAWLLAEGVETADEARRLDALGVPLVQGYFFARPSPAWGDVRDEVRGALGDDVGSARSTLHRHLVPVTVIEEHELTWPSHITPTDEAPVAVTRDRRPLGVLTVDGALAGVLTDALVVNASSSLAEVASRLSTRRPADTSTPVLVTDHAGRLIGALSIVRVLAELGARRGA